VRTYQAPLEGYLLGKIRGDRKAAEDLAQEIWTDVWQDLPRPAAEGGYDPGKGKFYTFVINRFARFKVLQWRESRSRSKTIPLPRGADESHDSPLLPDDSTPPPDRAVEQREELHRKHLAFSELFRLVLLCGGYPHQQLAFGFSKHVLGQRSDRAMEGSPERVDREYGDLPLSRLLEAYWKRYREASCIDDEELIRSLSECLVPVGGRLSLSVEALFQNDHASRKQYGKLLGMQAGGTSLRNYYVREAARDAGWRDKPEELLCGPARRFHLGDSRLVLQGGGADQEGA
jgi:hypothetical protein